MIYLFFGEEDFLISQQLAEIKQKHPAESLLYNYLELDGKKVDFAQISAAALAVAFLGSGRLIVVNNWLDANKEDIKDSQLADMLGKVADQTDLVFIEQDLDKRKKLTKLMLRQAQVTEFAAMQPNQVWQWTIKHAQKKGVVLSSAAVNKLVALVGANLRMLDQEIDKLIAFSAGQEIEVRHVDAVCSEIFGEDVFLMIDSLVTGKKDRALEILHRNIKSGNHPLFLIKMIVRQYRYLLFARDLLDRTSAKESDLVSRLKIHPYTAKKALAQARGYDLAKLLRTYDQLAQIDLDVKEGKVDVQLALDMLFAN